MKSDIMHPRPTCLICCTIHCCSRLDNCAYSPRYDTAKAFSCGGFVRADVNELSAHTKFHYSGTELLHLWARAEPQPVVVILKSALTISQLWRNSHASQCGCITDDRWCKAPQGIILKFLAHVNNGRRMKHLEMRLNLCRFRCVYCRQKNLISRTITCKNIKPH